MIYFLMKQEEEAEMCMLGEAGEEFQVQVEVGEEEMQMQVQEEEQSQVRGHGGCCLEKI